MKMKKTSLSKKPFSRLWPNNSNSKLQRMTPRKVKKTMMRINPSLTSMH